MEYHAESTPAVPATKVPICIQSSSRTENESAGDDETRIKPASSRKRANQLREISTNALYQRGRCSGLTRPRLTRRRSPQVTAYPRQFNRIPPGFYCTLELPANDTLMSPLGHPVGVKLSRVAACVLLTSPFKAIKDLLVATQSSLP